MSYNMYSYSCTCTRTQLLVRYSYSYSAITNVLVLMKMYSDPGMEPSGNASNGGIPRLVQSCSDARCLFHSLTLVADIDVRNGLVVMKFFLEMNLTLETGL